MSISVKSKVLFFLHEERIKNIPKGGPYGVGAMYYNYQKEGNCFNYKFIKETNNQKEATNKGLIRRIPEWILNIVRYLRQRQSVLDYLSSSKQRFTDTNINDYDILFFHRPKDIYLIKDSLRNYKGIVVLQSHCPEPESHELYATYNSFTRKTIPRLLNKLEKIDEYAFSKADYLIFPCEDAIEPYLKKWEYFRNIFSSKKIKYILTGIKSVHPNRSKSEIFLELKIPQDKFVICYAGRHNEVKGYDLLKQLAKEIFSKSKNVYFVAAGKEEPIKRLIHPQWKEIGWTTDAYSYISAADVFVLPNRETYFDLVMLEVLSLGKIVVASRTGGNRYFERNKLAGVFLYDTLNEAQKIISDLQKMTFVERKELGNTNMEFFKTHCQVSSMYQNSIRVLNEIWLESK